MSETDIDLERSEFTMSEDRINCQCGPDESCEYCEPPPLMQPEPPEKTKGKGKKK